MQNQLNGLRLLHEPILLDPALGISRAADCTHSPDTALTYLHYHDSLEIGFCYEGSGVFIVEDRIMLFAAGSASIIHAQEMHIAQSSPEHGSKWKFINLDPALLLGRAFPESAGLLQPKEHGFFNIIPPDHPSGLATIVHELIEESARHDPAAAQAARGLALCMFARLSRLSPGLPRRTGHSAVGAVSAALDYIVKNHARPLYIPELAALCGMSTTAFRKAFSKAMGKAPNDYINHLRIQLAAVQLLCSGLPVLEIALLVGYDSLSGFNRQFKKNIGMSPREWRKSAVNQIS